MADRDVATALTNAASAFATTARAASTPDKKVRATPEWTVADLVAHVAIEADRYRREMCGESDWSADVTAIDETNRKALAAHLERDVDANLMWLDESIRGYVDALQRRDLDQPSHGLDGGLLLTPRQGAGVLLGELVVHRRDLAKSTRQPTGISSDDAAMVVDGALHTLPAMLDRERAKGHRGTYEVRVRGYGRYAIGIEGGAAHIREGAAEKPDVVISTDPVAFLLTSYGRVGPVRTALTGKAFAFGRKPHRAFALDRMFHRV
jgi:uncharacterized protein (TIGR03083 family)